MAGYAALVAAGYPEGESMMSAGGDIRDIDELRAAKWTFPDLPALMDKAVELMRRPENVKAVALLASELEKRERIDDGLPEVFIEFSDGDCTEEEVERFLARRDRNRPDRP
jgi:uncharacterized protein (DUF1697 family)